MSEIKILSTKQKSFRLFRLLDKNDQYFDKNVRLNTINGICFMPLTTSRDELGDIVKKFFGYTDYRRYFTNYIYNKKFIYQPFFVPGRKTIFLNDNKKTISEVESILPKLKNPPTFYYKNNKNIILDYTDNLKTILPSREQLIKPNLIAYSEKIFPEIITRLGISNENPDLFKYMAKYTSSQPQPYLEVNHTHLIVPVPIKMMENSLITKFLNYTTPINRKFKTDLETIKFLSLIRFIFRAYCNDIEDLEDIDTMKFYIKKLRENNVIFFFYNNRFAFTIDIKEIAKNKMTQKTFFNKFKQMLILLISNNIGVEQDESIDKIIKENDEIDEENTTNTSTDLNVSVNKEGEVTDKEKTKTEKGNNKPVGDIERKNVEKFNSVLKNSMMKNRNEAQIKKSIKKESNELFKVIDSMKNIDHDSGISKKETISPKEDLKTKTVLVKKGQRVINRNGVDIIEDIVKTKQVADFDEEEETTENSEGEDKDIDEIIDEDIDSYNQDQNVETSEDDDENDLENEDDILEETKDRKRNKENIEISSNGELSDEEKKELLLEINKKIQPKRSDKQLRRIALVKDKYKSIKLSDDRTVEELLNDVNTYQINSTESHVKGVLDDSVQKSTLQDFERSYIEKTMKQDILKVFKSFDDENKSIPLHMIDYKEEDTSDRFNSKITVTVKFEDDNQKQHTIKLDIPKPNKDGTLMFNGSRKILKKQITLRPLIKIAPDKLALNSFYNKVIMFRQGTVLNRKVVVIKKLVDDYLKSDNGTFFKVYYGNNEKNNKPFLTTIEYDELAKDYHKFIVGYKNDRTVFFFDQNEIRKEIKELKLNYTFSVNKLPIGINYESKTVIDFNMNETEVSVGDIILDVFKKKAGLKPDDFDNIVNAIKPPKRRIYSRVIIQSFEIPLIMFLGALFGIRNIMKLNRLKYVFTTNKLEKDDPRNKWLTVKFKDGTLYFPEYPYGNSLLFNGLNEANTEEFYFDEYDSELPYIEFLYDKFKTRNMFKGWLGFKELFIDPITKDILRDEQLPTDFLELFLYANELLTDNAFTNETEAKSYRIRGYEIISHSIYQALSKQYLLYKQKEGKRGTISVPQTTINTALNKSQILENYDTINPINELKMKSGCTVKGVGVGGANVSHGYKIDRRAFGEDAVGIYAQSNVDNHNIGVVKELTTNPKIINTRGYLSTTKDPEKISKLKAGERMAPEELIMPCIVKHDHPNRVAFASAQWKHTLPIYGGGDPPIISSGYENTVIYQIGNTFAIRAEQDCIVDEINEKLEIVTVTNKDGTKQTYRYGVEMERNASFYLENNRVLNVKVGQKLKFNDIIAYSKEFFTKTPGGNLTFTMGRICKVGLMDDYFTEEDSSLVTEHLSKKMETSVTKKKQIKISAKSNIISFSKIGDEVKSGDVLMQFEDEKDDSSNTDIAEILDLLGDPELDSSAILYHMPKANASGIISDIDVLWTGELDEMSESCRKFVTDFIKRKKEKTNYEKEQTGKESEKVVEFKKSIPNFGVINGQNVGDNDLIIEYYITHVTSYGPGDKLAFYPSVKSVTPQVLSEDMSPYTETGKIDAIMGLISLSARQVDSPMIIGSLGKIVVDVSNRIIDEYFK